MVSHSRGKAEKIYLLLRHARREPGAQDHCALSLISYATLVLVILLCASLSPGQNNNSSSGAFIKAEPNPVPYTEAGSGTTRVIWSTQQAEECQIYVSVDGGLEKLFATGKSGSQEANWIAAGLTYEFRLYSGTERSQLLGSVTVTQSPRPATIPDKRYAPVTGLPLSPEAIVFLGAGGYVLLLLTVYFLLEKRRASKMVKTRSESSGES